MDFSNLEQQLENLLSSLTSGNDQALFRSGLCFIVEFKNFGCSQQEAYNKLLLIYEKYQDTDQQKSALVGDWLDCICGWAGNKNWHIWNEEQ